MHRYVCACCIQERRGRQSRNPDSGIERRFVPGAERKEGGRPRTPRSVYAVRCVLLHARYAIYIGYTCRDWTAACMCIFMSARRRHILCATSNADLTTPRPAYRRFRRNMSCHATRSRRLLFAGVWRKWPIKRRDSATADRLGTATNGNRQYAFSHTVYLKSWFVFVICRSTDAERNFCRTAARGRHVSYAIRKPGYP